MDPSRPLPLAAGLADRLAGGNDVPDRRRRLVYDHRNRWKDPRPLDCRCSSRPGFDDLYEICPLRWFRSAPGPERGLSRHPLAAGQCAGFTCHCRGELFGVSLVHPHDHLHRPAGCCRLELAPAPAARVHLHLGGSSCGGSWKFLQCSGWGIDQCISRKIRCALHCRGPTGACRLLAWRNRQVRAFKW